MKSWKWGSQVGALVMLAMAWSAGAAFTPVAHGQARESLSQAFDLAGRGTQIGVTVHDVDADDTKQARAGIIVDEVRQGSPADKAGMKTGDAVTEFDGERVRSARQFTRLVQETPAGRSVPAVLSRNGQRVTVNVTPERGSFGDDFGIRLLDTPYLRPAMPAPPAPPAFPRAPRPPAAVRPVLPFDLISRSSGGRLGVTLESLTEGLNEYFGVKAGVLVRSVADGSPAAKAGLKAGDVLTRINGSAVDEPSDVSAAIARLDDEADVSVEIVREKKSQTLKVKLESRALRFRSNEWS